MGRRLVPGSQVRQLIWGRASGLCRDALSVAHWAHLSAWPWEDPERAGDWAQGPQGGIQVWGAVTRGPGSRGDARLALAFSTASIRFRPGLFGLRVHHSTGPRDSPLERVDVRPRVRRAIGCSGVQGAVLTDCEDVCSGPMRHPLAVRRSALWGCGVARCGAIRCGASCLCIS